MRNATPATFYEQLYYMIRDQIEAIFQRQGVRPSEALTRFLENTELTNHFSMTRFFRQLPHSLRTSVASANFLGNDSHEEMPTFSRVVLLIDEFVSLARSNAPRI